MHLLPSKESFRKILRVIFQLIQGVARPYFKNVL